MIDFPADQRVARIDGIAAAGDGREVPRAGSLRLLGDNRRGDGDGGRDGGEDKTH